MYDELASQGAKQPAREIHIFVQHSRARPIESTPSAVETLPKDGDRVRVTGFVQVRKSETPHDISVRATGIQILELH